jgi:Flp pilus assembly protein TadG
MKPFRSIRTHEGGAAIVEFALSAPVLILMIYGIFEFSQLYWANASMQHALGEGARLATLCVPDTTSSTGCTNPTDTNIIAKENAKLFGPSSGSFNVQTPTTAAGYKTLTITYTRTMNFLFFTGPTITLTRTKQVYTVS